MNMNKIKSALDNLDVSNITPENLSKIVDSLSGKDMEVVINRSQQKINELNTARIQSETEIAGYRRSHTQILEDLRALGVDPKNINEELLNLCKDLVNITLEIENTMPDIEKIKEIQRSNNSNTKSDVGF